MLFTPVASAGATSEGKVSGRVTGTVTYRERIALLPGSVVRVTLQDVSRADAPATVLAEQTITTAGENVPIPFELSYDPAHIDPRHRYVVRAEIRDGAGALQWTSDTAYPTITVGAPSDGLELLVIRVSDPSSPGSEGSPTEPGRTFTFRCTPPDEAAFTFTVTFATDPGEAAITLPERFGGRSLVLPQTRAADGARFEDDGVVFWNKGDEALLEVAGQTFQGCTETTLSARADKVVFRAVGNEPGWSLELNQDGAVRFVYNYGEQEVSAPTSSADKTEGSATYTATTEGHTLHVSVTETEPVCRDSTSGQVFTSTVTVTLDGETFQGCGNRLE